MSQKKYYWASQNRNARLNSSLKRGHCGLFFTVDGNQARGSREAKRLIEQFLCETRQNGISNESATHFGDVSDALSSVCGSSQNSDTGLDRGAIQTCVLQEIDTGVKGTL